MDQKEFFARVLPGGNHYIAYPGKVGDNGRVLWSHKSFTEPYQGVQEAAITHRWGKDVYFAVASFRQARIVDPNYEGRTKAYRKQENVESLKSLFIDVDFKAYDSPEHAVQSVAEFISNSKIQKPTIIVRTGGGLHLYWTFPVAIPLVDWQPLANGLAGLAENFGLRADLQCTIDSARILRVPETLNHKYDPPRLVEVMAVRPDDINMEEMKSLLGSVVSLRVRSGRKERAKSVVPMGITLDPEVAAMFATVDNSDLGQGIGVSQQDRFTKEIVKGCGVLGGMLETGGDGDGRDLWNNMLLLVAYTKDGREYAHLLSQGDPRYTAEETEHEFDMKLADADKLGPTTCATFSRLSPKCQTCPHFNKIKSPISLGYEAAVELDVVRVDEPTVVRDGNTYAKTVDKEGSVIWKLLFSQAEMDRPVWLNGYGSNIIRITMRGLHRVTQLDLQSELLQTRDYLTKAFNAQMYRATELRLLELAMMSWMEQLHQEGKNKEAAAFGWADEGFVLSGTLYNPNGSSIPVASIRAGIGSNYAVKGNTEAWKELTHRVVADPRTELQVILATAFAAPLLEFTNLRSTAVVIRSPNSGVGKTSALQVARSVWGNPDDMSQANDTTMAVEERLATLRNMPWYWDELRQQDVRAVSNAIYQIMQGRSKERSTPSGGVRSTHNTHGMLVIATNSSITEMMREANQGTDAGVFRVLEIDLPARVDRSADAKFNQLITRLRSNHGHAGVTYARYLAAEQPRLEVFMNTLEEKLNEQYKPTEPERFWMTSIRAILGGAMLAKQAGIVNFDISRMNAYLKSLLDQVRDKHTTNDSADILAANIYGYFNTRRFITDKFEVSTKAGPPKHVQHINVGDMPINAGVARVRLAVEDAILVISQDGVREYAKSTGQQYPLLLDKLKQISVVKETNMDKGISKTQGARLPREWVLIIPAASIIGTEEMQKWATWAAGRSGASPGSSSGIAPSGSPTP